MSRIAGVNIPVDKRVVVSLTYIYGIGRSTAEKLCKKLGLEAHYRVKHLTPEQVENVRRYIEEHVVVEGDLRRKVATVISKAKDIGSYRGLRHRMKLPVRGQRTHTNARTRKGKAVPITGKKK